MSGERPGEAARLALLANLRDHRGWALPNGPALLDDFAEAVRAEEREPLTLAEMQETQPWTAPYSAQFEESRGDEPHRSLMHDLMHVTKAVGILSSIAEWADHGSVRTERIDQHEYEGRVADLVICALHVANNPPRGYAAFDLHRAVVDRVERVNGVAWLARGSS